MERAKLSISEFFNRDKKKKDLEKRSEDLLRQLKEVQKKLDERQRKFINALDHALQSRLDKRFYVRDILYKPNKIYVYAQNEYAFTISTDDGNLYKVNANYYVKEDIADHMTQCINNDEPYCIGEIIRTNFNVYELINSEYQDIHKRWVLIESELNKL